MNFPRVRIDRGDILTLMMRPGFITVVIRSICSNMDYYIR